MQPAEGTGLRWSSSTAFVLVVLGAVVGIGNLLRLPYLAAEYGGLAFMMVYAATLLLAVWPVLTSEWLLGRWARQAPVGALRRMATQVGASAWWAGIAVLAVLVAVLILSFYSVISGWTLAYTVRALAGALPAGDAAALGEAFMGLAQDAERGLAWHTLFLAGVALIVAQGLHRGIERATAVLLLVALLLSAVLGVAAWRHGAWSEALAIWVQADWSALGWRGALEAVRQACFSFSLGVGAMMVYGAYLPDRAPVPWLAAAVIVIDVLFSVLGGSALYALVLGAGLAPAPGLSMVFEVFPLAVASQSSWVAFSFYLLLTVLAVASAMAFLEVITVFLMERRRHSRAFAVTAATMLVWTLGLGTLLTFGSALDFGGAQRSVFEWLSGAAVQLLAPLVLLLVVVFIGRILPEALLRQAWGDAGPLEQTTLRLFRLTLRYPARILVVALLLHSLGLIEAMLAFWWPAA